MIKLRTFAVLLWTVLIVGLVFMGACSGGTPTIPDLSDVQDMGDGPVPGDPDLAELIDNYENLRALGGGVRFVDHPEGTSAIGVFDLYTGEPLTSFAHVTVEEADGAVTTVNINDRFLDNFENYPITVTASLIGYISKTIFQTDSNVIAIPMEPGANSRTSASIMGFTFNDGFFGPPTQSDSNWKVYASSTHPNHGWQETTGSSYSNPYTYLRANPYQNVGAMAFIYEVFTVSTPGEPLPDPPIQLIGCSYGNIGVLAAGAVGGWIMNITESGEGELLGTGNYSFSYSPAGGGGAILSRYLSYFPAGLKNASREVIPYYPKIDLRIPDDGTDTGTYDLTSFGAPALVNGEAIWAEAGYHDGASELLVVPWDPEGAVPDLIFGVPGSVDSSMWTVVPVEGNDSLISPPESGFHIDHGTSLQLSCSWTDATPGDTAGYQVVRITHSEAGAIWDIIVPMDIREITTDFEVGIPPITVLQSVDQLPTVSVTRVESTGLDFNDFDFNASWVGTARRLTSASCPSDLEYDLGD